MRKGDGVTNANRAFGAMPLLICVGLTSFCFVVTGNDTWLAILLASLVVPTVLQTYMVLHQRLAARSTVSLVEAIGVFVVSGVCTILSWMWFIFVAVVAAILIDWGGGILVVIAFIALAAALGITLNRRLDAYVATHGPISRSWRRLARVRFTLRGMIVGIALIALPLWPIHLWWMRPVYMEIVSQESMIADFLLLESREMAARAEECRLRANRGVGWDLDDEISEGLKSCPYTSDGPGHSWDEQAQIWDRAAERSRLAAQRHLAVSDSYELQIRGVLNGVW
jgi:hypothetical protein